MVAEPRFRLARRRTSAVAQAAPGTYGTLGRKILRGPNFENTDLGVSELSHYRFARGDPRFAQSFFNIFNQPQLGLPNATIGNRTLGIITSTASPPRILQLCLKVEF